MAISLARIKKMLKKKISQVENLFKKRDKLLAEVEEIDTAIFEIQGKAGKKKAGRKPGRPKKGGKPGRPKKAGKKGRPAKKKISAGGKKRGRKKGPKPPTLADYAVKVLEKAGKPLPVPELAKRVERMGYESGNTAQILRLTAGRGGRIKKTGDDMVKLG